MSINPNTTNPRSSQFLRNTNHEPRNCLIYRFKRSKVRQKKVEGIDYTTGSKWKLWQRKLFHITQRFSFWIAHPVLSVALIWNGKSRQVKDTITDPYYRVLLQKTANDITKQYWELICLDFKLFCIWKLNG